MSRTWICLITLTLGAWAVAGCGRRATPTQVAVATQPPPATATAPLPITAPVATVAGEIMYTTPPQAPTAAPAGPTSAPAPIDTVVAPAVVTGLADDGHHFWGAPGAPVTMIDFSDFM